MKTMIPNKKLRAQLELAGDLTKAKRRVDFAKQRLERAKSELAEHGDMFDENRKCYYVWHIADQEERLQAAEAKMEAAVLAFCEGWDISPSDFTHA
tara:strand:- start:338 stop:625 length:288 start_codon:yes stop_codon:yes gene_type:complete